jgi:DNA-binding MarR family transcriptional regulator
VTDGHGVHPDVSRLEYARRILAEIETGNGTSQRLLARRTGMALGLTNVVLNSLVRSGWVRVARVDGRVRYALTPEGVAEHTRISTAYFAYATRFYIEARTRVGQRLSHLSQAWAADRPGPKRVAFYGAAEVGEMGYACVQETDLVVTAVFDGNGRRRFFGTPVRPLDRLESPDAWTEFDVLVVMSFEDEIRRDAEARLRDAAFPEERVFWI